MLLALLLAVPAQASGPRWLMAPLARFFGVPPEAELAKCREAFRRYQAQPPGTPADLWPVFRLASDDSGRHREWSADLARSFAARLETVGATGLRLNVVAAAPTVPSAKMGRNQLSYLWQRGGQYAAVVREQRPSADFVWIVEVWAAQGKVSALQIFLLGADGQIAYLRAYNSHQFGKNLPLAGEAWMDFLITRLRQDLARPPEEIFPRDGVG